MREPGFRQIQVWVPDARTHDFKRDARRQALAVAAADRASDDQDFIEQISETGRSESRRAGDSAGATPRDPGR
ncbi:MAG TPA: antitoxin MazE-like protein [Arthrobacter sp.]